MGIGDVGRRIRERREIYRGIGMPQGELAKRVDVSQARLSGWENGKHDPHPMAVINRIAQVLETTPEYLLHGVQPMMNVRPEPSGPIKVYGPVSAGHGNVAPWDSAEIDVPIQFVRPDFGALVVDGDSMMPFLHHGDVAIFKDWNQAKPNYVMAAELPDGSWVVKKVTYVEGQFQLESLNAAYPPIRDAYRLSGFLVGFVRDDGPERLIRLNPYGLRDS